MSPGPWEWILIAGLVPAVLEAVVISVGVYFGIRFGLNRILSKMDLSGSETGDAMEIVRARYARGEIPRREYEQLREDLEAGELQTQK
jgi:uncharacterized membrane protein